MLKEIGIDFLHDEAKAILKDGGADVDPASNRVRFDPALWSRRRSAWRRKQFTLHARNPERSLVIGGRHVAFCLGRQRAQFLRPRGRPPARQPARLSRISSGSARASIRSISGAAIRSSRSTSTPRCAISTRCSTCSRCRTSRSTPTASGASAISTRSRWRRSRAASTTRRWSASLRSSPSSIRPRRCGSTRRCWKASSRWRGAIRSSC